MESQKAIITALDQLEALLPTRLGSLTKKTADLPERSAEGGTLEGYFEGTTPVYLHAVFYGESGHADEHYYYDDGTLLLIVRSEERVQSSPDTSRQDRYYLDASGALVLRSGSPEQSPSDVNGKAKALRESANEYLSLLGTE